MDAHPGLGARLQRRREERRWSQRDLARQSKVNVSIINRLETGELVNPRLETLERLAEALGLRLGYLAAGEQPMEDQETEQALQPAGTGDAWGCSVPAV